MEENHIRYVKEFITPETHPILDPQYYFQWAHRIDVLIVKKQFCIGWYSFQEEEPFQDWFSKLEILMQNVNAEMKNMGEA